MDTLICAAMLAAVALAVTLLAARTILTVHRFRAGGES